MPLQSIIPDAGVPFTVELPAQTVDRQSDTRLSFRSSIRWIFSIRWWSRWAIAGLRQKQLPNWWAGTAEQPGTR
ncbi:MAG: hypothetical protein R3C02_06445 [Planctomycetaceae bacterium]